MDKLFGNNGSYFHNSYLHPRDGTKGPIIDSSSGDVLCRLNGYAIIPIEEYYSLREEKIPEGTLENIAEMDKKIADVS